MDKSAFSTTVLTPPFWRELSRRTWRGGIAFLVIVVVWQLIASAHFFPPYLFPSPSMVVQKFYAGAFRSLSLERHLLASLYRVLIGYIPGIGGGLLLGILMGLNQN